MIDVKVVCNACLFTLYRLALYTQPIYNKGRPTLNKQSRENEEGREGKRMSMIHGYVNQAEMTTSTA